MLIVIVGLRLTLIERASAIGARLAYPPVGLLRRQLPSYWRRPEAYLDENARRAVSVWRADGPAVEERVIRDLRADLESGRWAERNRELLSLSEIDLGGRLLIAG